MENFNEKIGPLFKPIPSALFKSHVILNPFLVNRNPEKHIKPFNNINCNSNQKITEAIKKTALQYHSIFLQHNFFLDEPQSPELTSNKKTSETQSSSSQFYRKGYHFSQYEANNPIEDSICQFEIPELNAFVVSIFDGHGGRELSRFCAQNTQGYLEKWMKHSIRLHKYEKNKVQLIKDGLRELHFELQNQFYKQYIKKISQKQHKKIKHVGTCAITAVLWENKCIVANCGDSHSMIISQDRGSYNYQKLSQRYSVNNKTQRQRLISQFKDIDENIVMEQRKNVFYLKGMLQPTRSIGDYYLKHKQHYTGVDEFRGPYISCEPDVKVYEVKEHDKHLVIASDGLWDYLGKWEILKYVVEAKRNKGGNAETQTQSETQDQNEPKPVLAANLLIERVLQKVSNEFDLDINYIKSLQPGEKRNYHDDITIAVIHLQDFFPQSQP